MKSSEVKVSIVMTSPYRHEMLYVIKQLSQQFKVTVHARDDQSLKPFIIPGINYKLYGETSQAPGFLLGLEDELTSADVVMTYSTVSLASFQALRAARKSGIPLVTFVKEYCDEPYESFTNVRAIQYDLERSSSKLITVDKRSFANLRSHGVEPNRILALKPFSDASKFEVDSKARSRFRSYIGLDERDFVVLWTGEMDQMDSAAAWLETVSLLKQDNDLARSPKILLAGQGRFATELKYLSHELNIGNLTYFLQQDIQPFAKDLYNAADFIGTHGHKYAEYPSGLLDAALCGCVPVVEKFSFADEITKGFGVSFDVSPKAQQADVVKELMRKVSTKQDYRTKVREQCLDSLDVNHSVSSIIGCIWELAKPRLPSKQKEVKAQEAQMAALRSSFKEGRYADAMVDVEELLLYVHQGDTRSELLSLKGLILLKQDRFDEAFSSLSEAHSLKRTNSEALRGLGYLSWKNHSHEEAMIFFRRCLAVDSNDAEAMYGIALIYRRLGLADEALFWLYKRCSVAEITPSVITAAIQASQESSNPQKAISVLEYICESVGRHQGVVTTLGHLYVQIGQIEKGQALLNSLLENEEEKMDLAN